MLRRPLQQHRPSGDASYPLSQRLDSWKMVATFFGREIRTVQKWEKFEGLPIRRHNHNKRSSVYAFRQELETWWDTRSIRPAAAKEKSALSTTDECSCHIKNGQTSESVSIDVPLFIWMSAENEGASFENRVANFAEGLREELLIELSRRSHKPIASARQKSWAADWEHPLQSGGSFGGTGADFRLGGSIRCHNNQVRVCVQLADPRNSCVLWSERFDFLLVDILQTQTRLAAEIAQALPIGNSDRMPLQNGTTRVEVRKGVPASSADPPSSLACLQARSLWRSKTQSGMLKAIDLFEQARRLDPKCETAYAGLADCYLSLAFHGMMPPSVASIRANAAALAAIRINPKSEEARNSLADVMTYFNWDWPAAERECQTSIQRHSVDTRLIMLHAILMSLRGQDHEAESIVQAGLRLEPDSQEVNTTAGRIYYNGGDFKKAAYHFCRSLEIDPELVLGHLELGLTLIELGERDESIGTLKRAVELSDNAPSALSLLGYAHSRFLERADAVAILERVKAISTPGAVPGLNISALHLALGDRESALRCLTRAHNYKDARIPFLSRDPRFRSLNRVPAFQNILSSTRLK
jgi:TolB-like protein/tetratricopeptide (TPR) repeat protein